MDQQPRPDGERPTATTAALAAVFGDHWTPLQITTWRNAAALSLASPAAKTSGVTDELLAEQIHDNPPADTEPAPWYIERIIKRRRNGNGKAEDPMVEAFKQHEAAHGREPDRPTDDDAGAQIWDLKLTRFREEHAAGVPTP